MSKICSTDGRPTYDLYRCMETGRAPQAERFARQILDTCQPFLSVPAERLSVLDVGCGYGFTTVELAKRCAWVVGIEPSLALASYAEELVLSSGRSNAEIRRIGIADLTESGAYDLAVLDNVLEHMPDQALALERISVSLRRGGVLFVVVPNKLWPIEVHYRLPFLSYLPLPLANAYLQLSRRGSDYTDASYAPSYLRVRRLFRARPELAYQFTLPANIAWATQGESLRYRFGVAAIRRFPSLWAVSKVFLVTAVKR